MAIQKIELPTKAIQEEILEKVKSSYSSFTKAILNTSPTGLGPEESEVFLEIEGSGLIHKIVSLIPSSELTVIIDGVIESTHSASGGGEIALGIIEAGQISTTPKYSTNGNTAVGMEAWTLVSQFSGSTLSGNFRKVINPSYGFPVIREGSLKYPPLSSIISAPLKFNNSILIKVRNVRTTRVHHIINVGLSISDDCLIKTIGRHFD